MKKASSTIIAAAGMTVGLLGFALPAGAATHIQDSAHTHAAHFKTKKPPLIKCFKVEGRDHDGKRGKSVEYCVVVVDHNKGDDHCSDGRDQGGDNNGRGQDQGGDNKGHGQDQGGDNKGHGRDQGGDNKGHGQDQGGDNKGHGRDPDLRKCPVRNVRVLHSVVDLPPGGSFPLWNPAKDSSSWSTHG